MGRTQLLSDHHSADETVVDFKGLTHGGTSAVGLETVRRLTRIETED